MENIENKELEEQKRKEQKAIAKYTTLGDCFFYTGVVGVVFSSFMRTNTWLAVLGLCLGCMGILGIIFSSLALSKIRKYVAAGNELTGKVRGNKNSATICLVLCIVCTVLWTFQLTAFTARCVGAAQAMRDMAGQIH